MISGWRCLCYRGIQSDACGTDVINDGSRIMNHEHPLLPLMSSRKQMGSITLEVSAVSEVGVLTENKLVLNGAYKSCTDLVIDIEYENTEHHDWEYRWLFNKVQL